MEQPEVFVNQPSNTTPITPRVFPKKIIFVVFGLVILGELIWAGSMLLKPKVTTNSVVVPNNVVSRNATVSLMTNNASPRVGDEVLVNINISSDKKSDAMDLIIDYDPLKLTIQSSITPIKVGNLYSSYPVNSVDQKLGRITISGVTDISKGVLTNGVFGSVSFKAKATGATAVSIEFVPGSTQDSNIVESITSNDVIERVENLTLNIR